MFDSSSPLLFALLNIIFVPAAYITSPVDGKHIKVEQFNHGMNASNNKLKLSNISSNLEFTSLLFFSKLSSSGYK